MGKRVYTAIARHKILFGVIIILLVGIGYVYFPRNVKTLLLKNDEPSSVEILEISEGEPQEIILNEKQQEELLEALQNSYVRKKIFRKEYVSEDYMGYMIYFNSNDDIIYFLAADLISVNDCQYQVYGSTLAEELKRIVGNE